MVEVRGWWEMLPAPPEPWLWEGLYMGSASVGGAPSE
tara:strand:+ start:592 stop:702 length:111 start_codon:yes stop_codon:yes gene_type:complete